MFTRDEIADAIDETFNAQYQRYRKSGEKYTDFHQKLEEMAETRLIDALTEVDKALAHIEAIKK